MTSNVLLLSTEVQAINLHASFFGILWPLVWKWNSASSKLELSIYTFNQSMIFLLSMFSIALFGAFNLILAFGFDYIFPLQQISFFNRLVLAEVFILFFMLLSTAWNLASNSVVQSFNQTLLIIHRIQGITLV